MGNVNYTGKIKSVEDIIIGDEDKKKSNKKLKKEDDE